MAEVYAGRLNRGARVQSVALKRLKPLLQADPECLRMFRDEAQLGLRLNHPNIVRTLETGTLEGCPFIAMELLEGHPLSRLLQRERSLSRLINIAVDVLSGLSYAHGLGVIHRDVSPQNIFVTAQGVTKLLDFGIAKSPDQAHQTRAGLIKGKPSYMAPEQLRGEPTDHRADLFALGVVLYEALLGELPFAGAGVMQVIQAVLHEAPLPPRHLAPDFPEALEKVLLKALSKRPKDRFPDAIAMRAALLPFIQETDLQPEAPTELCLEASRLFADTEEIEQEALDFEPTVTVQAQPRFDYLGWLCFVLGLLALLASLLWASWDQRPDLVVHLSEALSQASLRS